MAGTILFPLDVASSVVKTVSSLLPGGSAAPRWRAVCAEEGLDAEAADALLHLAGKSYYDAMALVVTKAKGNNKVRLCACGSSSVCELPFHRNSEAHMHARAHVLY